MSTVYIHVYSAQDDEDAQYDVVHKPSHPEPETEEAKEKLKEKVSHIYVCTCTYIGVVVH